ncbi:MAG: sensor histidine kinase [Firmicutes bacterium]|nr:sensor histidine kinase [Bacillota bacterium]
MRGRLSLKNRQLSLSRKITLFSFGLIVSSTMLGGIILIQSFSATLESEIGSRALAVARTVAQMEEIQNHVGKANGQDVIQPIAERIRLATIVEYVVVLDMDKIRHSHPLRDRIGQPFEGGDEGPAFADHEYISRAVGIMGPSVRAFVPLRVDEGTRQVGVVVVGILTPTILRLVSDIRTRLYGSLLFALFIGLTGSVLLAGNIKRAMHNMEPVEMARLLEERSSVFHSIGEGIIAIDRDMNITVINAEAKRIIGLKEDVVGRPIRDVVPGSHLPRTVEAGIAEYNQESVINSTTILVSRIPIVVNGKLIGAVATFKDKTEIRRLAEELTGVKKFIEALRVQNHEHANKLHTIAGLIQLKRHEEAIDYIFDVSAEQEELTLFLTKYVRDYSIAGLLFGKYIRAKEMKITLEIDQRCRLEELPPQLDSSAVVIIVGNILENAMEAVAGMPSERRKVQVLIRNLPEHFLIRVHDLGAGIALHNMEKIFHPEFSTKNSGRGVGLSLVYQHVASAGGKIRVDSCPEAYTTVEIMIPHERRVSDEWD